MLGGCANASAPSLTHLLAYGVLGGGGGGGSGQGWVVFYNSLGCCYITLDCVTGSSQNAKWFSTSVQAFPSQENQYFSENDAKCNIFHYFHLLTKSSREKYHYMTQFLNCANTVLWCIYCKLHCYLAAPCIVRRSLKAILKRWAHTTHRIMSTYLNSDQKPENQRTITFILGANGQQAFEQLLWINHLQIVS
jgi:hypothetical protein